MSKHSLHGREVILEYHSIGNVVKVTAMDTATLTEVTTQGPASAGEALLKSNAIKRLEYVLKKKGLIS
ncbi:MAG: hypothetical protein CMH27_00295 [Micavibrio sp.]|nr:hypothetical protein [Micavibrio sp.]|tara:strand:- start:238 stop:441 length:204 start_codon:yes stop_codon:yes gene_type:complete